MEKRWVLVLVLSLIVSPLWADPPGRVSKKTVSAGDRIADEAAEAVAEVLTGEKSAKPAKNLPPGLAKKGKVPPGHAMKQQAEKKESPIKTFIKGLFNQ